MLLWETKRQTERTRSGVGSIRMPSGLTLNIRIPPLEFLNRNRITVAILSYRFTTIGNDGVLVAVEYLTIAKGIQFSKALVQSKVCGGVAVKNADNTFSEEIGAMDNRIIELFVI